jgi:hypothetical protein
MAIRACRTEVRASTITRDHHPDRRHAARAVREADAERSWRRPAGIGEWP